MTYLYTKFDNSASIVPAIWLIASKI